MTTRTPTIVVCDGCSTTLAKLRGEKMLCYGCQIRSEEAQHRAEHRAVTDYSFMVKPIREALKWAHAPSTQQRGALIQHHGIHQELKPYSVRIANRVIVFASSHLVELTTIDVLRLRAVLLRALGKRWERLLGTPWNGAGCTSVSFPIYLPMPTIEALVTRYHKGCRTHRGGVFCKCGWFSRGYHLAKLPEGWT